MSDERDHYQKLAYYAATKFSHLDIGDATNIAVLAIFENKRRREAEGKPYSERILLLKAYTALAKYSNSQYKHYTESSLPPRMKEEYLEIVENGIEQHRRQKEINNRKETLEHCLAQLTEEERIIIDHTFGLNGKEKLTAKEIKKRYGYKWIKEVEGIIKNSIKKMKELDED